jgi:hypothetical protein
MLGGASSSFLFSPSFLSFLQHPLLFTFPCSFCSLHNQPLTDSPPLYSRIRSQFPNSSTLAALTRFASCGFPARSRLSFQGSSRQQLTTAGGQRSEHDALVWTLNLQRRRRSTSFFSVSFSSFVQFFAVATLSVVPCPSRRHFLLSKLSFRSSKKGERERMQGRKRKKSEIRGKSSSSRCHSSPVPSNPCSLSPTRSPPLSRFPHHPSLHAPSQPSRR